jgi:GNAT superfamily N-acetyltransferase
MAVTLARVRAEEYDAFFAMFADYSRELDSFDPQAADSPWNLELHRNAILDDMDGRELLWIVADGARAGLAIVRVFPDFPDESRDVAAITEFYVLPTFRRTGTGRAAVQAILTEHRARGTFEVEASVLRENGPALAFWQRMGFDVRSFVTARKP